MSVSQATATLNKATMQVAGARDRSIATAAWNLAQSRNTYETSWAALDLDSSGWSLGDSSLVMMGFGGSSTATTTTTSNTTTVTTTGSGTGSTSSTSTGVSPSVSSGASYFTRLFTETGATQDGSINPPSSGSQIPGTQTNPQTNPPTNPQPDPPTPAPPTVPVAAGQNDAGDDAPGYEPPATRSTPLNIWTGLLPVEGEDPGTSQALPPMASPEGPWDISVTPPGDHNLYTPFASLLNPGNYFLPGTAFGTSFPGPFGSGHDQRLSEVQVPIGEETTQVLLVVVISPEDLAKLEAEQRKAIETARWFSDLSSSVTRMTELIGDGIADMAVKDAERWLKDHATPITEAFNREGSPGTFDQNSLELLYYVQYAIYRLAHSSDPQSAKNMWEAAQWKLFWLGVKGKHWSTSEDTAAFQEMMKDPVIKARLSLIFESRVPTLLPQIIALQKAQVPDYASSAAGSPFGNLAPLGASIDQLANILLIGRYGANGERFPYQSQEAFVRARLKDDLFLNPFVDVADSVRRANADWKEGFSISTAPGRNEAIFVILMPVEVGALVAEGRAFNQLRKHNLDSPLFRYIEFQGDTGFFKAANADIADQILKNPQFRIYLTPGISKEILLPKNFFKLTSKGSSARFYAWQRFGRLLSAEARISIRPSPWVGSVDTGIISGDFGKRDLGMILAGAQSGRTIVTGNPGLITQIGIGIPPARTQLITRFGGAPRIIVVRTDFLTADELIAFLQGL